MEPQTEFVQLHLPGLSQKQIEQVTSTAVFPGIAENLLNRRLSPLDISIVTTGRDTEHGLPFTVIIWKKGTIEIGIDNSLLPKIKRPGQIVAISTIKTHTDLSACEGLSCILTLIATLNCLSSCIQSPGIHYPLLHLARIRDTTRNFSSELPNRVYIILLKEPNRSS